MMIPEDEFAWMKQFAAASGLPVTFGMLQSPIQPEKWRDLLKLTEQARAEGAMITAQIACRPTGMVLGWQSTVHPFVMKSAYREIAKLPFAERLAHLKDPAVRDAIVTEVTPPPPGIGAILTHGFGTMFRLERDGRLDYEPRAEDSIAAEAQAAGVDPQAIIYDMLMENDGRGYIYLPLLNYSKFNFDHIAEMMRHPATILSLSDGGAHCGVICDASFPTYMLSYWARDRERGERLPLEKVVAMQTRDTARLYGMNDRGMLAPGLKADINVIDFERLNILAPEMIFDLPAEGRRLVQRAEGYRATVVAGVVTFEDGEATGEMPGRLVRGPQAAPALLAAE
jgi:N-acyl-D-aspartate/D-glutamate deacylase